MNENKIQNKIGEGLSGFELSGKKVLAIIPDYTRTFPMDKFFKILFDYSKENFGKLDFLIASGTHSLMSTERICSHLGITLDEWDTHYKDIEAFNHSFNSEKELKKIGEIPEEEVFEISEGQLKNPIKIVINKRIFDYDYLLIIGPVFPHEVVGFSGGTKYLFPGIAGEEIINQSHWLGALITNYKIIGNKDTPVRRLINRAAEFVKIPIICISVVVDKKELADFFVGTVNESWSKAVSLTAKVNIVYKKKLFGKVIGIASPLYDDLWTAGKVMYKLEPVIEDGGELIVYAPGLSKISDNHDEMIEKVGYHTIQYILKKYEKFKDIPEMVLAHSSHIKGTGMVENGNEIPRIEVTLATKISKERCEKLNLGYLDPDSITIADFENREDEGILVVKDAGEVLYRVK